MKALLKLAGEAGIIADRLQAEDPSLNRLDAVIKALKIQKEVK